MFPGLIGVLGWCQRPRVWLNTTDKQHSQQTGHSQQSGKTRHMQSSYFHRRFSCISCQNFHQNGYKKADPASVRFYRAAHGWQTLINTGNQQKLLIWMRAQNFVSCLVHWQQFTPRLGERGGREKERARERGGGGGERAHNKWIMYNCFITGFKFIMFYHILFHLERLDRVQSKWTMYNCFITSFKFIMFYHILFHLTWKQHCKRCSSYAAFIYLWLDIDCCYMF